MSPFGQTVLVSLLTGGLLTAGLTFVQFLIKRHDDKEDKKSGTQAELAKHGKQLDRLTQLAEDSNEEQKKTQQKLADQGEAIAGLEHDRIVHVGGKHIRDGWISLEEYDDIEKYLYEPYRKLGGNGTAESVMEKLRAMIAPSEKGENNEQ